MTAIWYALLVLVLSVPLVKMQSPFPPQKIGPKFIEPYELTDDADRFRLDDQEFLVVNKLLKAEGADKECWRYHAKLVKIDDHRTAGFLAEALSETQWVLDTLWTAGRRLGNATTTTEWVWSWPSVKNGTTPINPEMITYFTVSTEVKATDRDCLGFARLDHDQPLFVPLVCEGLRSVLCQRPRGSIIDDGSTHPGWIKIGRRYYKIFATEIKYDDGDDQCAAEDVDATLAVVTNFAAAQTLGRYLLIGRPSLENAWIGAKYYQGSYEFDQEKIILSNTTDTTGYPPWRTGKVQKPDGCVLLDRHLSNITLFVEARCHRIRPFICYKTKIIRNESIDVIIGNFGYRLHLREKGWYEARDYCNEQYSNYSAKLSEISAKVEVYNLLYVMGENATAVQHIWIGGKYNSTKDKWVWDSTQQEIPNGTLFFIQNQSYTESVEKGNICLDMDRENHLTAMHYGTVCRYLQPFVCSFTADNLHKLEEEELKDLIRRGEI